MTAPAEAAPHTHHWIIATTADESHCWPATCKECGATRALTGGEETDNPWDRNKRAMTAPSVRKTRIQQMEDMRALRRRMRASDAHGVSQTQYKKGCRCGPCLEYMRRVWREKSARERERRAARRG